MADAIKLALDVLLANGAVTALVGQRIYGGILPENIDPSSLKSGAAIVVTVRGGSTHSEMPIQTISIQVVCWAGVNEFEEAHAVYGKVFPALHGLNNLDFGADGHIISCLEQTPGQDVVDPDMGWATVVCHYEMMVR